MNHAPEYAVGWFTLSLINAGLAQSRGKSGFCQSRRLLLPSPGISETVSSWAAASKKLKLAWTK